MVIISNRKGNKRTTQLLKRLISIHFVNGRSIVSQHLNGFLQLPGCEAAGVEWDRGVACSLQVRRLNLWSADLGDLKLKGASEGP